jgi:GNAT superfamily N-acetyltransferase
LEYEGGNQMSEKILNEAICLKQYMSEEDYKEISKLEEICCSNDKTNLKLELDYRFNMRMSSEMGLREVNEFMYYVEDTLAAYICIGSFGGSNTAEVNGMTHPNFRRKGLFKRLFGLAIDECKRRNFNKILLLSDGNSDSGIKFINFVCGEYDFSEYRMKAFNKTVLKNTSPIKLRRAERSDGKEIVN